MHSISHAKKTTTTNVRQNESFIRKICLGNAYLAYVSYSNLTMYVYCILHEHSHF